MKKITKAFENKANIAYIIAGYPSLDNTKQILNGLDKSDIDLLEIGIAYSDPISDGKVIENAANETLKNGICVNDVFNLLENIDKKIKKPLVFLVYYNIIFSYGIEKFIKKAKQCGISGFIVPDLPYEESTHLRKQMKKNNLALITLVSLSSPQKRIQKIVKKAEGFIYAVGLLGITGGQKANINSLSKMIKMIKSYTKIPVAIGFGLKNAQDVKNAKKICDGAILGTSVVEVCGKYPKNTLKNINKLFKT